MVSLFYQCDKCGEIFDWYHRGGACKCCDGRCEHALKELYVVGSKREKSVLDDAFKIMNCSGYDIAVLPISNDGKLFADDIIFPSSGDAELAIKELRRIQKGYSVNIKTAIEFFSTDFSKYDRVLVCCAGHICGKLSKYVLSYKFEKEGRDLYEMDLSPACEIMKSSGYAESFEPDSLNGLLGFTIAAATPTSLVRKADMDWNAEQWRRLTRNQTGLCICEGMSVINVPPTTYDSSLIDAASEVDDPAIEFVIIAVHARTRNVSWEFLSKRAKALVKEGKIVLRPIK